MQYTLVHLYHMNISVEGEQKWLKLLFFFVLTQKIILPFVLDHYFLIMLYDNFMNFSSPCLLLKVTDTILIFFFFLVSSVCSSVQKYVHLLSIGFLVPYSQVLFVGFLFSSLE